MAGKKVEVLEGEIAQLKSELEEKWSDFQNQISSNNKRMEEKFAVMEEMLKKLLEAKIKAVTSEAKETIGGHGRDENPNTFRGRENPEVEILEGEDGMSPLEPLSREERSSDYARRVKKMDALEGEMEQLKVGVEEKYVGVEGRLSAIENRFRNFEEMMKKMLETQSKASTTILRGEPGGKEIQEDGGELEIVFHKGPPCGALLVGGWGYSEGRTTRREADPFGRLLGHGERWTGEGTIKKARLMKRSKNLRKQKAIERAISKGEKMEEKACKMKGKVLRVQSAKSLYE
ncbi:hypothetical protein IEQ34_012541 [Dendrobium chrysotoxum]|uniref:Uncharacterized protein n=1 Tax=Dendrobium chrysotoxum TaxID=161865 RepID=A0AAV7GUQ2_DENCH|nr:hypothetical protein IEQ34_012541 [Dendrobium chrysotoxum]